MHVLVSAAMLCTVLDSVYIRNLKLRPLFCRPGASSTALARSAGGGTCMHGLKYLHQCQMHLLNRLQLDPAKHRLSTATRSVDLPPAEAVQRQRSGALTVRGPVRPQPLKLPRSPEGEHMYISTEYCCIAGGRGPCGRLHANSTLGVRRAGSAIAAARRPACCSRESPYRRRRLLGGRR
jgi:hypothetical protein